MTLEEALAAQVEAYKEYRRAYVAEATIRAQVYDAEELLAKRREAYYQATKATMALFDDTYDEVRFP